MVGKSTALADQLIHFHRGKTKKGPDFTYKYLTECMEEHFAFIKEEKNIADSKHLNSNGGKRGSHNQDAAPAEGGGKKGKKGDGKPRGK